MPYPDNYNSLLAPDRFVSAREEKAQEAYQEAEEKIIRVRAILQRIADAAVEEMERLRVAEDLDWSDNQRHWAKKRNTSTVTQVKRTVFEEMLECFEELPEPADVRDRILER